MPLKRKDAVLLRSRLVVHDHGRIGQAVDRHSLIRRRGHPCGHLLHGRGGLAFDKQDHVGRSRVDFGVVQNAVDPHTETVASPRPDPFAAGHPHEDLPEARAIPLHPLFEDGVGDEERGEHLHPTTPCEYDVVVLKGFGQERADFGRPDARQSGR